MYALGAAAAVGAGGGGGNSAGVDVLVRNGRGNAFICDCEGITSGRTVVEKLRAVMTGSHGGEIRDRVEKFETLAPFTAGMSTDDAWSAVTDIKQKYRVLPSRITSAPNYLLHSLLRMTPTAAMHGRTRDPSHAQTQVPRTQCMKYET